MESKSTTAVRNYKVKIIELYFLGYSFNKIAPFVGVSQSVAARAIYEYEDTGCVIVESKINK